ncbi:MAG TPA: nitroreductase family protein [Acidimicrobiales bacterium]|nr:nitroreductase family protein [Acidimicrobiales bacterium]
MDALEALFARRSIGRLTTPAPSPEELTTILRAAAAAPDHLELRPWRFVVLEGDGKDAFGAVLADAYLARCAAKGEEPHPAKETKERTKLGRAPVVVVVCAVHRGDAVPFIEQFASAAAAAQNALLAATALGYGSMWRTGDPAYDANVMAALGLATTDAVVGFLYIGTPHEGGAKPSLGPQIDDLVHTWTATGGS